MSKHMVPLAFVLGGMVGLYFKVEYSGWVLAIGLFIAWSQVE